MILWKIRSKQSEFKLTVADWVKIRALITQAVAEAYAEATDEEIHEHVMYSIIEAREGRADDMFEDE